MNPNFFFVLQWISGILLAVLFCGTGFFLLRLFAGNYSPLERYVYAFGLGAGAWGMVLFFFGITSMLYPSLILFLLAIGIIGTVFGWKLFLPIPELRFSTLSRTEWGIVLFLMLQILFSWFMTFLPPTDNDGVAYHLAVPKIFLENHGFVYLPSIFHSNWPFLPEMLYAASLSVIPDGTLSVQLHFFSGLACAAILYELSNGILLRRVYRLTAVLLFITLTTVRLELRTPYIDLFTAMYILLSWITALRMYHRQSIGEFLLLGICIGFAASTKLTAPVYCFIIPFLAMIPLVPVVSLRSLIPKLLLTGSISLVIVLPWYLKSFVYTGNPFWPFAYSVFGGKYLDADYAAYIATYFSAFSPLQGITGLIRLPIEIMKGTMFSYSPTYLSAAACVGILTIPFTWEKSNRSMRMTAMFIVWGVIVWYFTSQQVRFLIPFLGLIVLAVVFQFEQLLLHSGWKRYLGYALGILIVVPIVHRIPLTNVSDFRELGVSIGVTDKKQFLQSFEPYSMSEFINADVPVGKRAALIGEVRGFYIDKEYVWTGFNSTLYFDLNRYAVDSIESKFRHERISHIVLRVSNLESELNEPARTSVQRLLSSSTLVYSDQWYSVYRLRN
ncbi:MAG: hypothetical protein WCX28_10425 [Bacteriovoracaceae bacterium]